MRNAVFPATALVVVWLCAARAESFPIEDGSQYLLVPGFLGEDGPYQWILDTGCQISTFDRDLRNGSFEIVDPESVATFADGVAREVELFKAPRIHVGDSIDVEEDFISFVDLSAFAPAKGILGMAAFQRKTYEVNWDSRELTITAEDTIEDKEWNNYDDVPLFVHKTTEGVPTGGEVEEVVTLLRLPLIGYEWMKIDTGSNAGVTITSPLLHGLTVSDSFAPTSAKRDKFTLEVVEAGSLALTQWSELKQDNVCANEGAENRIGMAFLSLYNWVLNTSDGVLLIEERIRSTRHEAFRNYHGMALNNQSPRVIAVAKGGLADQVGIEIGDRISTINGTLVETASQGISAINESQGDHLKLGLTRNGTQLTVKLPASDYYSRRAPSSMERIAKLEEMSFDDPIASLVLGRLYQLGHGVEKNLEDARKWYRRAVLGGNSKADFYLVNLELEDPIDPDLMILILNRLKSAALDRVPEAALRLGQLYLGTSGVDRDVNKAFQWLSLAATAGVVDANELLEPLSDAIPEDEKIRVNEWVDQELSFKQ